MSEFIRNCPTCNKEITYNNKYNMRNAERDKRNCKSCGLKKTMTPERLKQMSDRVKGKNNPMYGKPSTFRGRSHTPESIAKMLASKDFSVYKTEEFRKKQSKLNSGKNNPMYGRSIYDVWVEKYGEVVANQKMEAYRKKQSKLNSGKNNSMYGKPSPTGSGSGWCGWYSGWFFRSIRELSYMINVIERFNLKWENGELDKFKIKYKDHEGIDRTYRPDFIIENKYMVEIKPKALHESKTVRLKAEAGIEFCNKKGYTYKLTDVPPITTNELINLYEENKIKFTNRYEEMFIEQFG